MAVVVRYGSKNSDDVVGNVRSLISEMIPKQEKEAETIGASRMVLG